MFNHSLGKIPDKKKNRFNIRKRYGIPTYLPTQPPTHTHTHPPTHTPSHLMLNLLQRSLQQLRSISRLTFADTSYNMAVIELTNLTFPFSRQARRDWKWKKLDIPLCDEGFT